MEWNEMVDLLSLVAIRDNRTVDNTVLTTWFNDIGALDFEQARDAVAAHFLEHPGTWLMAGHVYQRVKATRAKLIDEAGTGAVCKALGDSNVGDEAAYRNALIRIREQVATGKPAVFNAIEGGRRGEHAPMNSAARQEWLKNWRAEQDAKRAADRAEKDARIAAEFAANESRRKADLAYGVLLTLADEESLAAYQLARDDLGPDATREQIMIRAAELADHSKTRPIEPLREDVSEAIAKTGCNGGCSPLGHEHPCRYANADSPIGRDPEYQA